MSSKIPPVAPLPLQASGSVGSAPMYTALSLSSSTIGMIKEYCSSQGFRDVLIITGYMTGAGLVIKYGPDAVVAVPKYLAPKFQTTKSFILNLKCKLIESIGTESGTGTAPTRRRKNLVRWLGSNLPDYCFAPTERIYLYIPIGGAGPNVMCSPSVDASFHELVQKLDDKVIPTKLIPKALEELEDICEDGQVIAYERTDTESGSLEDDEEEDDEDDETTEETTEALGDPGDEFYISELSPFAPRAHRHGYEYQSTPIPSSSFRDFSSGFHETQRQEPPETLAKISELEAEVKEMRLQIQMIMKNSSVCGVSVNASVTAGPPAPPPPPPPPPPPMPLVMPGSTGVGIKIKTKSQLTPASIAENGKQTSGPVGMADVLKELNTKKLKPTPKSPGGTPLKVNKLSQVPPKPSDYGGLLNVALQKRFQAINPGSPPSSDDEGDMNNMSTGDENSFGNNSNENKENSSAPQAPVVRPSQLKFNDPSKSRKFNRKIPGSASGTPEKSETPASFGQHLLKKRVRNSLKSKSEELLNKSLRELNENEIENA